MLSLLSCLPRYSRVLSWKSTRRVLDNNNHTWTTPCRRPLSSLCAPALEIFPIVNQNRSRVELLIPNWNKLGEMEKTEILPILKEYYPEYLSYNPHESILFLPFCNVERFCSKRLDANITNVGRVPPVELLRKKLQNVSVKLGEFPWFESQTTVGTALEKIKLDVRFATLDDKPAVELVAIFQHEKFFLIACPPERSLHSKHASEIHRLVNHQLTGVIEFVEKTPIPSTISQHANDIPAYRTYDIWLVAEFLEKMEERFPNNLSVALCDQTRERLEARFSEKEAKRRPLPELEETKAPDLQVLPCQYEAIRFFLKNNGRGILAFEMGLGKTICALAFVALKRTPVLVVTVKNVRDNWIKEATTRFPLYFEGRTMELGGGAPSNNLDYEEITRQLLHASLVSINYEALEKWLPLIAATKRFDCIILGESHCIKTPTAKRTMLMLQHKDQFRYRLLLSGTPITTAVDDFCTQLEFIGHGDISVVDMTPGALHNALYERKIYLHASRKEELPHLDFAEPEIVSCPDLDFDERLDLESIGEGGLWKQVQDTLLRCAMIKAETSALLALDLLQKDPSNKVIIFTERVHSAIRIFEFLETHEAGIALLHHGTVTSFTKRKQAINEFCNVSGSRRILVSTRQSLGTGGNLQCANKVIFNDLPYTAKNVRQAAARVQRYDQKSSVRVYWMTTNTLFDDNLVNIMRHKFQLHKMYVEGKSLTPEQDVWMRKGVSALEMAGIAKPKKTRTRRKKAESSPE